MAEQKDSDLLLTVRYATEELVTDRVMITLLLENLILDFI